MTGEKIVLSIDESFDWMIADSPEGGTPLKDSLSVLRRPRTASDRLTPEMAASLASDLGNRRRDVKYVTAESRLALGGLGSSGASSYIIPMENGWVCHMLSNGDGFGCFAGLYHGVAVVQSMTPANRAVVHGVVADDVVRVAIHIGSTTIEATVGKNSLFAELPQAAGEPVVALTVQRSDGRSSRIPIPA